MTRVRWACTVAPSRPVPPRTTADDLAAVLGGPLPDQPTDPGTVVDLLVAGVEPGLMAMPSGRFFGWVIGGTLPAALGADWLTRAWDQNAGMRFATPGVVAAGEAAGRRGVAPSPGGACAQSPVSPPPGGRGWPPPRGGRPPASTYWPVPGGTWSG